MTKNTAGRNDAETTPPSPSQACVPKGGDGATSNDSMNGAAGSEFPPFNPTLQEPAAPSPYAKSVFIASEHVIPFELCP